MKDQISRRFQALFEQGNLLLDSLGSNNDGSPSFWVEEQELPGYQTWVSSVANLFNILLDQKSPYVQQYQQLLQDAHMKAGIPTMVIRKMQGLLASAKEEWDGGLLRRIEYIVAAETFDDFLDHAEKYHKGNMKIEAAVLASAVLEDTLKRIAKKNAVEAAGMTLEQVIDELAKANVIEPVKAKRFKVYAGVRNHALHAEWDKLDIRNVGDLIGGLRTMIEDYL